MKQKMGGFSTVELLLTIAVAALFLSAFYQLFTAVSQSNAIAQQQTTADALAYYALRGYNSAPSYTCDNTTNLLANANAPGQVILNQYTATGSAYYIFSLPIPITVTIRAFAPQGCGANTPTKLEATVLYGPQNKTAKHAIYVN